VVFLQDLEEKKYKVQRLVTIIILCFLSSLVMYSFLPMLLAIGLIIGYKTLKYFKTHPGVFRKSPKTFLRKKRLTKSILLIVCLIFSGYLFGRVYVVNSIKYHNPVPECNQVLTVKDCVNYYAWDEDYVAQKTNKPPITSNDGILAIVDNGLSYFAHWSLISLVGLYGTILPLRGIYSLSYSFFFLVFVIGSLTVACSVVNRKRIFKNYKDITYFSIIVLVYVAFLFARNYHDYLRLGQIIAVSGRYLVPILIYVYAILAVSAKTQIDRFPQYKNVIKLAIALIIVVGFIGLGGFWQYNSKISPLYGHLSPTNTFILGNHLSN